MKPQEIERIISMHATGMSSSEIAEELYQSDCESRAAAEEDDSDEAIERRYMVSQDDRFDSRGEALRPLVNDAGEPWWM